MSPRYSETLMEHFLEPSNRGKLENPSGTGLSGTPGQGPYFVFQITCDGSVVTHACFQCHNCGVTIACGSVLSKMVKNRSLQECASITQQHLVEALDGIPVDKRHVLEVSLSALRQAISDAST